MITGNAKRQVVICIETTGLEMSLGHRVIEIAALELVDRCRTRSFHTYINPQREICPSTEEDHGLTNEFLSDKPRFDEIGRDFSEFVRGAELIAHNAPFDLGFLNAEFKRQTLPDMKLLCPSIVDTWEIANRWHPRRKNSLSELVDNFGIDCSGDQLHGALLDVSLLAEIYLRLTH